MERGTVPSFHVVIPVGNESGAGNDSANTFSGLFAPFPAGKEERLIHVNIIVSIYEFDLGTGARPILLDFLRDSGFCHGMILLYISVNLLMIVFRSYRADFFIGYTGHRDCLGLYSHILRFSIL